MKDLLFYRIWNPVFDGDDGNGGNGGDDGGGDKNTTVIFAQAAYAT